MLARIKEAVNGVGAIVLLAAVFWMVKHNSLSRANGDVDGDSTGPRPTSLAATLGWEPMGARSRSVEEEEESLARVSDEVWSMPACVDVGEALGRLAEARKDLLHAATADDLTALEAAREHYRLVIGEVRIGFARLHTLVSPEVYETISEDLIASYCPPEDARVHPWELSRPITGISR